MHVKKVRARRFKGIEREPVCIGRNWPRAIEALGWFSPLEIACEG